MKNGFEAVAAMPSVQVNDYTPKSYTLEQPGINLYAHIATHILASLVSVQSNAIFSNDELVQKSCELTEALLKRLP